MASSYRKHATTAMMPVMEAKRAESPKASGPYMRVMMGEAKIARAWAMAVPPASLRTSLAKDGTCNGLFENLLAILYINLLIYCILHQLYRNTLET